LDINNLYSQEEAVCRENPVARKGENMEKSILEGGIEEIEEIKEQVVELNKCKQRKVELDTKEKEAEKKIAKKEKAIEDEIKRVTRQRREQLEATFDEQLENLNEKMKTAESNKEKAKKKAVAQRINEETADVRSEEEELQIAGRSVFKQENIPLLYNNRLFFALYFPSGVGDLGLILLTLALAFFVVPFGIYTLFFDGMGTLYLGLIYILTILVFGGIYLIVNKKKYKHLDALNRVREMRKKIRESKKKQRNIKRRIEKDEDESSYDLEAFDQEIEGYRKNINELYEKKKAALLEFDNETAKEIRRQITEAEEEELNALKEEYQKIYDEGKENVERLNELSVKLSTEYEGVLGREVLEVEKLDLMAQAIREGRAENIGEAKDVKEEAKEQ